MRDARAAFATGLCAAALSAWPAALRFERALAWQAFWVLFAGSALIMAPLSLALAVEKPASRFTRALTMGALMSVIPLVPLATALKVSTHHRPLGGATFSVVAAGFVAVCTLVSSRLIDWAGEQRPGLRTFARFALLGLAALASAALLRALIQGLHADASFRSGIFDALRALGLSTLAARFPLPAGASRRLRGVGLAAFIAVVTVGACLGRAPAMQAELAARSPVLHWPLLWLGG